jgi:LacI family transcriptional regulator
MALKRVTMQEIADACGLSRNTVSKIFNDRGSVPEATRKRVFRKAQELGYYQRPEEAEAPGGTVGGNIALLTQHKFLSHNFGAFFITSFTDQICRSGYTMKMYEVDPGEIAEKRLPPHLDLEQTAGILVIELFDREYLDMICSLKKPTVFVDGYARASKTLINCDLISMENVASETALVSRMIRAGARRIGFVGDAEHCNSFYERWVGYCTALGDAGLPVRRELCILEKDSVAYGDPQWLLDKLAAMPELPDAFACANDYLAIHLMTALKKRGLSIPGDVMVAGFDGSLEAAVVEPSLSTAQIPSAEIGRLAAALLSERIQSPACPFRWTYVKTTPVWGKSTR